MIATTVLEVLSQALIGKYCFSKDEGKSTALFKVEEVHPYMAHETIPKGWKKKLPKDFAPEDQMVGLRLIGKSTKEGDKPRQRIVKAEELLEFEFFKTS